MSNYDPDDNGMYPPDEEDNPYPPMEQETTPVPSRGTAPIPMGEVNTGEQVQGLVAFTRSVNLGTKDNNAHFRIELPFVVQPGWDWPTVAAQAADAFFHCKAVIYDQAGLPFTVDEGGVLRETLRHHFPDAEPVRGRQARQGTREPSRGGGRPAGGGSRFPHPRDMDQPEHISDELWWDLVDNYGDWFDNRPRKAGPWTDENGVEQEAYKATASDFVRRSDRKSVWLRPFAKAGSRGGRSGGGQGRGYDN
jgi:hypothetical protein